MVDPLVARSLIQKGIDRLASPQRWADLGAGDGLFTQTLAALLPPNSNVIAIDKSPNVLARIPTRMGGSTIEKRSADFTHTGIIPDIVDGILMANALHYVQDQDAFLTTLLEKLNVTGRIIIVEYDTDTPNAWVPYPISFASLCRRFEQKFKTVTKMNDTPSVFHRASIYSALLIP